MSITPSDAPIPMLLHCPECNARHIDIGEFATKAHYTHSCQHCGHTWRPAVVATVGVRFLPGFKNDESITATTPEYTLGRKAGFKDALGYAQALAKVHGVSKMSDELAAALGADLGPPDASMVDSISRVISDMVDQRLEKTIAERDHFEEVIGDLAISAGCKEEWSNLHEHGQCIHDALLRETRQPDQLPPEDYSGHIWVKASARWKCTVRMHVTSEQKMCRDDAVLMCDNKNHGDCHVGLCDGHSYYANPESSPK